MKKTTKKSPTGAPLGNPLKFFREGGEKIKTMFKKGGYNTPTQSLPKKNNGGPGSGMGSMYSADQAYDALMNTPTPTVVRPIMAPPSPKRLPPILDSPDSLGTPPIPGGRYGNTTKGQIESYGPPRGMGNTTMKSLGVPNPGRVGPYGNTTSGQIYMPEEKNGGMMKKGGATKAKKFAALAPPFNKATAADRIVGAKKNAKKK